MKISKFIIALLLVVLIVGVKSAEENPLNKFKAGVNAMLAKIRAEKPATAECQRQTETVEEKLVILPQPEPQVLVIAPPPPPSLAAGTKCTVSLLCASKCCVAKKCISAAFYKANPKVKCA